MKKLTFKAPEGMELPAGVKKGDEFDALATVKMGEDGSLSLVAVDGYTLEEAESEKDDEDAPGEDANFADVVAQRMGKTN